jgi:diguanylate cyclase (GGDEF)-like protein
VPARTAAGVAAAQGLRAANRLACQAARSGDLTPASAGTPTALPDRVPIADSILIVEDDAVTRDAMAALLRDEGYQVETATSGDEAVATMERHAPALILTDLRMPGGDGMELLARVRARPGSEYIPVMMISALDERARRVAGLDRGADDFVVKPVDAGELLARVRVQLRRVHREHELVQRALTDPLTGVLNRRGIMLAIHREHDRCARTGAPYSVLMADVDHFKALNDAQGHAAGDAVLRRIAASLSRSIRLVDQIGRFGGDEFLILMPEADADAAAILSARLGPLCRPITLAIGTATRRADDTIDTLIGRADQRMYQRKRSEQPP